MKNAKKNAEQLKRSLISAAQDRLTYDYGGRVLTTFLVLWTGFYFVLVTGLNSVWRGWSLSVTDPISPIWGGMLFASLSIPVALTWAFVVRRVRLRPAKVALAVLTLSILVAGLGHRPAAAEQGFFNLGLGVLIIGLAPLFVYIHDNGHGRHRSWATAAVLIILISSIFASGAVAMMQNETVQDGQSGEEILEWDAERLPHERPTNVTAYDDGLWGPDTNDAIRLNESVSIGEWSDASASDLRLSPVEASPDYSPEYQPARITGNVEHLQVAPILVQTGDGKEMVEGHYVFRVDPNAPFSSDNVLSASIFKTDGEEDYVYFGLTGEPASNAVAIEQIDTATGYYTVNRDGRLVSHTFRLERGGNE
jgi:hypothetical protein